MSRYFVSPSRVGRYFFHQCERHLRYFATPAAARKAAGLPAITIEHGPATAAILEGGYRWEEEVVDTRLAGQVGIAPGKTGQPLRERVFGLTDTRVRLAALAPGEWLYQPTLEAPPGFHAAFGLDPEFVGFPACRPDLIWRIDDGCGAPVFRIVDVKAAQVLKTAHRVQVGLYVLLLDALLAAHSLPGRVDQERGGIWLAGRDTPETFDLGLVLPHVRAFLRETLPAVLAAEAGAVTWHLHYRCEWCELYAHCRAEADAESSVSLLPYLSVHGRRHLRALGIDTLAACAGRLEQADAETLLAGCASLEGRAERLRRQLAALADGRLRTLGAASLALPQGEHVRLLLSLQREPLGGEPYALALLATGGGDVWGEARIEAQFVAAQPEAVVEQRRAFVRRLHALLVELDRWNAARDWSEQKSLQVYVLESYEAQLLRELLLDALDDAGIAEAALTLLFHFVSEDLVAADAHPGGEQADFPLVVVGEALRALVALPIPLAWRLAEVCAALPPDGRAPFVYRAGAGFGFELSNALRADAIHAAWYGNDPAAAERIARELRRRLWATTFTIDGLRAAVREDPKACVLLWPPRFRLPETASFRSLLLSRLAFLVRYESLLGCLAVRTRRVAPRAERLRDGACFTLTALGDERFRAEPYATAVELEAEAFGRWLLTTDDAAGEHAQLAFPDYRLRNRSWFGGERRLRLAQLTGVQIDADLRTVTLTIKLGAGALPLPLPGDRLALHPGFLDYNTDRIVGRLHELDASAAGESCERWLGDDAFRKRSAPLGTPAWIAALVRSAGFTASQRAAFRHMLCHAGTRVWGPPGTGKTHFLALALRLLADAQRRRHRPLRVFLSAFTHTAIDNALRKLVALDVPPSCPPVFKLGTTQLAGCEAVAELDPGALAGQLATTPICIVGGTVHALQKAFGKDAEAAPFDLLVIDEASQLKVPEALLALSRLGPDGRLLVVGDHQQLPPILQGSYPEAAAGSPCLHRSIFEALDSDAAGTCQLLENFRMNAALCAFPAAQIYGPGYRSASAAIAAQRLRLTRARDRAPDWIEAALDPAYPWVLGVLDGVRATDENRIEAGCVAALAAALRARLCDPARRRPRPWPDTAAGDAGFWREGLFVISPHHAQLRAIRAALEEYGQRGPAFADTVDKMQGQECAAVIVSYGVADAEYALQEAAFIYSRNRLNVALTRARAKCIVFLPRPLLEPPLEALEDDTAAAGIACMRALCEFIGADVACSVDLPGGGRLALYRAGEAG